VSWLDWNAAGENEDLLRFFKGLIAFRRNHALFRQREFIGQGLEIPKIIWHGVELHRPDWSWHSSSIAVELQFDGLDSDLYFIFNAFSEPLTFQLPFPAAGKQWHRMLDTSLDSPGDFADPRDGEGMVMQDSYAVSARSVVGFLLK
jgi:glycogen operon protein